MWSNSRRLDYFFHMSIVNWSTVGTIFDQKFKKYIIDSQSGNWSKKVCRLVGNSLNIGSTPMMFFILKFVLYTVIVTGKTGSNRVF
jgi:hypothetical protein